MPYRRSIPHEPAPESSTDLEELISYALLTGAGALPVVHALARHASLGAEATIGLFMLLAGAAGLLASVRAAWLVRAARRDASARSDRAPS